MVETTTYSENDGNSASLPEGESRPSHRKTALTDTFREHFAGDAPITDKARNFAKARPWTSAVLAGVAALAVLNTLRGRR